MSDIRVHKALNLAVVKMGKENLVNLFYGLIEKYNKQVGYSNLILTKQELWEMAGYSGEYKSEYILELIQELTKSDTYKLQEALISGSMFVTQIINEEIIVEVPQIYQQLLFYKHDLDLMSKAKKQKIMTIQELDYWDRTGKDKSKFLVLLKKADILGVNGKYNKRLYAILMQFKKTKKYICRWEDFKEVLEIPKSYRATNIDDRILNKAKKELLKVNLKITKIKKIKKGISISRIEICFKILESEIENIPPEKIENPGKIIFTEKEYYNYADYLKKNNEKDTKFQRESFRLLQKIKV